MKIYLTEMEQHGKRYDGPNIVAETLQGFQYSINQMHTFQSLLTTLQTF